MYGTDKRESNGREARDRGSLLTMMKMMNQGMVARGRGAAAATGKLGRKPKRRVCSPSVPLVVSISLRMLRDRMGVERASFAEGGQAAHYEASSLGCPALAENEQVQVKCTSSEAVSAVPVWSAIWRCSILAQRKRDMAKIWDSARRVDGDNALFGRVYAFPSSGRSSV